MTAEPPPASASPSLAEGLAITVTQVYAEGEQAILLAITANVKAALNAPDPVMQMHVRSGATQTTVRRILDHTETRARRLVPQVLREAYGRGHGDERRLVEDTVRQVLQRLAALRTGILGWVTSLWNRLTAAIAGKDARAAADRMLQRDAGRGITGFRDATGRAYSLTGYVGQTVQHEAGQAVIAGFLDRLPAEGDDLVIVTESPHPCPLCDPWEHKVLSITGADPRRPSVATARRAGLFHPNCHHTLFAWRPGFTWPPHSLQNRPGTYEATQRQRTIERHIRSWKRRQAAALDDLTRVQAARKVRAWQAELRQHLAAEGLRRSRQRERTDYGHTSPRRHAHG